MDFHCVGLIEEATGIDLLYTYCTQLSPPCHPPASSSHQLRPSLPSLAWPMPRPISQTMPVPPRPSIESATQTSRANGVPASAIAMVMAIVSWTVVVLLIRSISIVWLRRAGTRYVHTSSHLRSYGKIPMLIPLPFRSTPVNTNSSSNNTSPSAPAPQSQSPSGQPRITRRTAVPAIWARYCRRRCPRAMIRSSV